MENKHVRRGLRAACCVLLLGAIIVGYFIYTANTKVVRQGIRARDIEGKYIVCEYVPVTGFDWYVLDESGKKLPRGKAYWCVITGPDPMDSGLILDYEFTCLKNRYVFYVQERREIFHEDFGDIVEYIVTGWDILAPVRHTNPLDSLLFPSAIIDRDTEDGALSPLYHKEDPACAEIL